MDTLRKLLNRLGAAPFAVMGVHCDDDGAKARTIVEESQITWPSFLDGRNGPISKNWNIHGWPTVFVIDRQGVIRYRNVRDGNLGKAVDALLME